MARFWNWFWEMSWVGKIWVTYFSIRFLWFLLTSATFYFDRHALAPYVPEIPKEEFPAFSFKERFPILYFAQARNAFEDGNAELAEKKLDLAAGVTENGLVKYARSHYYLSQERYAEAIKSTKSGYFSDMRIFRRRALNREIDAQFNQDRAAVTMYLGKMSTAIYFYDQAARDYLSLIRRDEKVNFPTTIAKIGFSNSVINKALSVRQFDDARELCKMRNEDCAVVQTWAKDAEDPRNSGRIIEDVEFEVLDDEEKAVDTAEYDLLLGAYFYAVKDDIRALEILKRGAAVDLWRDNSFGLDSGEYALALSQIVRILHDQSQEESMKTYLAKLMPILDRNKDKGVLWTCNYYCHLYKDLEELGVIE